MSLSEACCTLPPVKSDYSPIGTKEHFGDIEVYVTGPKDSKAALICFYDIFGFHNNTLQFCDNLAAQGFRVYVPDFFRGKPWSLDDFPPKNPDDLKQWGFVKNSWEGNTHKDVKTVLEHIKKSCDATKLGAIGFCWGGKMVFEGLKGAQPIFLAGAGMHPAAITEEDIKSINAPVTAIITKDEAHLLEQKNLLQPSVSESSQWLDFTDQFHGFCAARGDFSNPANRDRATEVIKIVAQFFKKHLSS